MQKSETIPIFILNLLISDPDIENAIKNMRYEEVVQTKNPKA